jgi:hypothetical protein
MLHNEKLLLHFTLIGCAEEISSQNFSLHWQKNLLLKAWDWLHEYRASVPNNGESYDYLPW